MNRRTFIKTLAVVTATTVELVKSDSSCCQAASRDNASEKHDRQMIPDTLDLAAHGRMGINGILGSLNPELDYECVFLNILDTHPAYMLHWSSMVSGVMPKYIEALPLLRLMSGSDQDQNIEAGFMDAMIRNMSDDGLIYDRAIASRPWNVGVSYGLPDWDEDYANMAGNGRGLVGLIFQYQKTQDDTYKKLAKKMTERMFELAIVRDDIAYYPNPGLGNDFSYPRHSGWKTTEPPQRSNEGFEGATLFYLLQPVRGFTRYCQLTGDERFLELSGKFAHLALQSKFWGADNDMNQTAGAERGHFKGHFHGRLAAIRGLLDYGLMANDTRIKFFCRDAYEYARQHGIHRLGVFPHSNQRTEGCTIGDMVGLAVTLTRAGLGDYWDDVEQYARNGLICAQATDLDELTRVSNEGKLRPKDTDWGGHCDSRFHQKNNKGVLPGQELQERVLERSIGAFGHLDGAHYLIPMMMHCCTANGNQGIYFAWDSIVLNNGNSAEVNMWLNRRSPWVDVWSHLPFEGKLMVKNKGMRQLFVRIPGWAQFSKMRIRLNGKDVNPIKVGNRFVFNGLQGNEILQFEVPVPMESTQYSLVNLNDRSKIVHQYNCDFKGHSALRVQRIKTDQSEEHNWYRLFRRDHMCSDKTPEKPLSNYVHPDKLVDWMVG